MSSFRCSTIEALEDVAAVSPTPTAQNVRKRTNAVWHNWWGEIPALVSCRLSCLLERIFYEIEVLKHQLCRQFTNISFFLVTKFHVWLETTKKYGRKIKCNQPFLWEIKVQLWKSNFVNFSSHSHLYPDVIGSSCAQPTEMCQKDIQMFIFPGQRW